MEFLLILRSSSFGKTSLYSAEPLLLGWFWAFFSFAGQFLLRIPPGNSRVWSHYAQWSFTLLTDFPRGALWNTIDVEVYHGHAITTTCQCCPRKNSVETLSCQEFLQILWWNCNKFCQDWLEIISVFIHTHWNPVLKHIHITSSKVILENCSHVFTPSRPLIVAIVSPQYYRRTAISTTSPILKHHEGGSSIGQGFGGNYFWRGKWNPQSAIGLQPKPIRQQNFEHPENLFYNRL